MQRNSITELNDTMRRMKTRKTMGLDKFSIEEQGRYSNKGDIQTMQITMN